MVPYGFGSDELFLGAGQFLGGKPVLGERGNLLIEVFPHQIDLRGIGAQVKSEDTRRKAHHLRGADEIGQSEFLADAVEKA